MDNGKWIVDNDPGIYTIRYSLLAIRYSLFSVCSFPSDIGFHLCGGGVVLACDIRFLLRFRLHLACIVLLFGSFLKDDALGHSLFNILSHLRYSLLAIRYSLFAIRCKVLRLLLRRTSVVDPRVELAKAVDDSGG